MLQDRASNKWSSTQPMCGWCRCWGRDQHHSSRGLSFWDIHQVVCMGELLAKTLICISMQYSGQLEGRRPTLTTPPIPKLRRCRHKSSTCTVTQDPCKAGSGGKLDLRTSFWKLCVSSPGGRSTFRRIAMLVNISGLSDIARLWRYPLLSSYLFTRTTPPSIVQLEITF